jgi:hypothetical protein
MTSVVTGIVAGRFHECIRCDAADGNGEDAGQGAPSTGPGDLTVDLHSSNDQVSPSVPKTFTIALVQRRGAVSDSCHPFMFAMRGSMVAGAAVADRLVDRQPSGLTRGRRIRRSGKLPRLR